SAAAGRLVICYQLFVISKKPPSLIREETEHEEGWAWGQARPTGGVARAILVFLGRSVLR
ncbi:MAG: hypothetical protein ACLFPB_06885, partial [Desulfovermiculus sp.]